MTAVNVADDHLSVDLQGIDRFWALRRCFSVPLSHVRTITRTPYRTWRPAGFRLLGAELPGFLRVGSFSYRGERVFWDVHHPERSIEIELVSERFDRLIFDVEKPEETTREIQRAIGPARPAVVRERHAGGARDGTAPAVAPRTFALARRLTVVGVRVMRAVVSVGGGALLGQLDAASRETRRAAPL